MPNVTHAICGLARESRLPAPKRRKTAALDGIKKKHYPQRTQKALNIAGLVIPFIETTLLLLHEKSLRPQANQGIVPRLLTLGLNGETSMVYDYFK